MKETALTFSGQALAIAMAKIYGIIYSGSVLLNAYRVDFDFSYASHIFIPNILSIALPLLLTIFAALYLGKKVSLQEDALVFTSWSGKLSYLKFTDIQSFKLTQHALLLSRAGQADKVIGRYIYDKKDFEIFYEHFSSKAKRSEQSL